jgi:hypothetical protein
VARRGRPCPLGGGRRHAAAAHARHAHHRRRAARGGRPAALRRLPHRAGRPGGGARRRAGAVGSHGGALRAAAQDAGRVRRPGPVRSQQHHLRARAGQLPHAGRQRHGRTPAARRPVGRAAAARPLRALQRLRARLPRRRQPIPTASKIHSKENTRRRSVSSRWASS